MNVNLTMFYYIGCCLYHNSLEMIGTKRLCCIVCENNVTKSNSDSVNTSKREIKTHLLKHHVILSYFYKCSSGFIMTRVQCWEEYTHTHTHTHTHRHRHRHSHTLTHTHTQTHELYLQVFERFHHDSCSVLGRVLWKCNGLQITSYPT